MTKKEKRQLKEAIANEEYIDQNNELIFKKLIFITLIIIFNSYQINIVH